MKNRILILLTLIFVFAYSSLFCSKVELGMNGSAVQIVNYMLMDTGYLAGGADGIFGSATEDAVKRFQADYGLDVDGIVGSQTMAALSEASGREAPAEEGVGSYQRRIVMDASAYTADDPGNSGFTATGLRLRRGMVSVDPDVIPLGSQLYIEGYGYATAEDTGGSIVGNRIDLAMDSITEALNFGRREVVVYVL